MKFFVSWKERHWMCTYLWVITRKIINFFYLTPTVAELDIAFAVKRSFDQKKKVFTFRGLWNQFFSSIDIWKPLKSMIITKKYTID